MCVPRGLQCPDTHYLLTLISASGSERVVDLCIPALFSYALKTLFSCDTGTFSLRIQFSKNGP